MGLVAILVMWPAFIISDKETARSDLAESWVQPYIDCIIRSCDLFDWLIQICFGPSVIPAAITRL